MILRTAGGGIAPRPSATASPPVGGSVSSMLSNCQFETVSRLGGAVGSATVTYQGQRTDGTHRQRLDVHRRPNRELPVMEIPGIGAVASRDYFNAVSDGRAT